MAKKSIIVRYTGVYPHLCHGEWHVYVDGHEVPCTFGYDEDAHTFGEYRS